MRKRYSFALFAETNCVSLKDHDMNDIRGILLCGCAAAVGGCEPGLALGPAAGNNLKRAGAQNYVSVCVCVCLCVHMCLQSSVCVRLHVFYNRNRTFKISQANSFKFSFNLKPPIPLTNFLVTRATERISHQTRWAQDRAGVLCPQWEASVAFEAWHHNLHTQEWK